MKKQTALKRFFSVFLLVCLSLSGEALAGQIEDIYKDLAVLDKTSKISRRSYVITADKFYKIYSSDPTARRADEALLGAARAYRRSYERFKIAEDMDKSLRYYRILQGSFTSAAARDAYLECADVFTGRRDTASAKFTLNKLIAKHPDSAQARKAKTKLATLEKKTGREGIKPAPGRYTAADSGAASSAPPPVRTASAVPAVPAPAPVETVRVSSPAPSSGIVTVRGVRYFSDKDYTRVVVDLSSNAGYESRWLKEDPSVHKPPRLTVDISGSVIESNIARVIPIKDGLLSSVRLGYHASEKRTRVVLDSENVKDFTVFQMSNPSRIVIDVFSSPRDVSPSVSPLTAASGGKSAKSSKSADKEMPAANNRQLPSEITLGAALGLKIKTIVIDPGHGGKDPGAVYNKLKEKDIVLEIAKYLRDYLKQDPSLKIHMTRDTDIFIPLEERTAIANKLKADIFVSVHANAAKNTKASGIETFVFNVTNDRAALEVAALENQATTKSISDLQGILKDILKYSKLEESLSLAGSVQNRTAAAAGLAKNKNLGVKQAPFYVLVGARMPSILVETGFVSNKEEADRLRSSAYRKKIAKGIYDGIREYIEKYNGH